DAQEGAREDWEALGIDPAPFPNVRFWAPPRRQSGDVVVPDTGGRFEGVDVFSWTPRAFIDQDLLEFCFTDATDARNQIPFIRERVQLQLKRWAVGIEGMPGAVALRDPAGAPDGHAWSRNDTIPAAQADVVITDLPSLVRALEVYLEPEDGGEPDPAWTAKVMPGTLGAFLPRMHAAAARLGHLIRADQDRLIDRAAANVTVVAIQSLHEQAQRFVVGALLRETFREKEDTGQRLPLSVIVLDELNKDAPPQGTG